MLHQFSKRGPSSIPEIIMVFAIEFLISSLFTLSPYICSGMHQPQAIDLLFVLYTGMPHEGNIILHQQWRGPHLPISQQMWHWKRKYIVNHYSDIMMPMASQITSLRIVYSTVYSGTDQRKHQSFTSLACVRGIHRWPVNSLHKGQVTWIMFPFYDVIMTRHQ